MESEAFVYSDADFIWSTSNEHERTNLSAFDAMLQEKWKLASEAKLFNYQLDHVDTKTLPGKYRIISQLNAERLKLKRKTEEILRVVEPFDPNRFNFTKIRNEEILKTLYYSPQKSTNISAATTEDSLEACLVINNSPICFTHSLLVPFLNECRPQVCDEDSLRLALHVTLLSSTPNFRIAFNSMCGCATVNHLHHHLYYLPHPLYTESAECIKLAGPCHIFKDYYAPGFVFQLENKDIDSLLRSVMMLMKLFLDEGMAHNIYITRGAKFDGSSPKGTYDTIRVVIWARRPSYEIEDDSQFAQAVVELGGHVPYYAKDKWPTLTEDEVIPTLKTTTHPYFVSMLPKVIELFS